MFSLKSRKIPGKFDKIRDKMFYRNFVSFHLETLSCDKVPAMHL